MNEAASIESRRVAIIIRHVAVVTAELNENRDRGDEDRAIYHE
jgi:hypothetical protein